MIDTRHVDDEDKGGTEMMTPGGTQKIPIINESGLYSKEDTQDEVSPECWGRDLKTIINNHHKYFNPRTREGCDEKTHNHYCISRYFNPRTREGCDGRGRYACS